MLNHTFIPYQQNKSNLSLLIPIGRILDKLPLKKFKKGDLIFCEDALPDKVFFIEEGIVQVNTFTFGGKCIVKNLKSKGDILGELALTQISLRPNNAKVITNVKVKEISKQNLADLMIRNPRLNSYVIEKMGERILSLEKKIESLILDSSRNRIIKFLEETVSQYGQRVGYEHVLWASLTHREIGEFTNTSRQTVTTTLNELRRKGLLLFNRKRLLIRDLKELKKELR